MKRNQRIDNKDIKGWKVSFRKNDFFMQHLPGAKTDHMKS